MMLRTPTSARTPKPGKGESAGGVSAADGWHSISSKVGLGQVVKAGQAQPLRVDGRVHLEVALDPFRLPCSIAGLHIQHRVLVTLFDLADQPQTVSQCETTFLTPAQTCTHCCLLLCADVLAHGLYTLGQS